MALIPNPITSKKRKNDVRYRVGVKCGTCVHFIMGTTTTQCELVEGTISPDGVCALWTDEENSGPYNKEYFMAAHKESMENPMMGEHVG